MLYVTGMLQRSDARYIGLGYLRGVVRVVCDWDV
jgi:ethanolamine transporter EutH